MSAIHDRISMHRKAMGLTQEQLGAKLGISGQAVSKWEKGESMPDILLLPELCDIFGITIDDLLRDHPTEVKEETRYEKTVQDFCACAKEWGRNTTVVDMISHMVDSIYGASFQGKVICAPDDEGFCIHHRDGMSFAVSKNSFEEKLLSMDPHHTADYLEVFKEPVTLSVLRCMSFHRAATEEEIHKALNQSEGEDFAPEALDEELLRALKASDGEKISCSMIQRKCSVGYGTASKWIERLTEAGAIEKREESPFFYLTKGCGVGPYTVRRTLHELMKRHIICMEEDGSGKTGYLWDVSMTGVLMLLAGCHAADSCAFDKGEFGWVFVRGRGE